MPILSSDTEICLIIKIRDDYWLVGIDGLTTIPRVDERFYYSIHKREIGQRLANSERYTTRNLCRKTYYKYYSE